MTWLVAAHATAATVALLLGAYTLLRRTKGDRLHKRIGRVWVVAMYWTVLSSFAIRELNHGQFSFIHLLSILTFCTLTIGLRAALRGEIDKHRGYMRGSYFGLLGAFLGAVAVPQRSIPQLAAHDPIVFVAAAVGCLVIAAIVIAICRGVSPRGVDHRPVSSATTGASAPATSAPNTK